MWKKSAFIGLGLITASVWGVPAYSQPHFIHGPGPKMMMGPMLGDGPGMMLPLLLKGVDLTPEQETKIQSLMATQHERLGTLFKQLRVAHEEMADKLFAPGDITAEDIAPQVQKVAQLREQLMRDGLAVTLEVRQVLTPEQLAKAAQIKERMRTLHSEMRGLLQAPNAEAKADEPEDFTIPLP